MLVETFVETTVSGSPRARQLEAMFDVPFASHQRLEWRAELDLDEHDWRVGLIVGPSGSGKTTLLEAGFGAPRDLVWDGASVVDDFAPELTMPDIAAVCQAVGFNTIPAWLRPYAVLSTGERFRVEMARRLVEASADDVIVVDEFTSVVDRQVAQIGAHAVAKYLRRAKDARRLVAATCHYDVIDWLQPDWILDAATREFTWRSVQPRPAVDLEIRRVPYATWALFAPYHYLTATLNRVAKCYCALVDDRPVSLVATMHRPHPKVKNVIGFSRWVTLPDWQGLGIAFALGDQVASCFKALGYRTHTYPAHPSFIRAFDRSPSWVMTQRPGYQSGSGAQRTGPISRGGFRAGALKGPAASMDMRGWHHGSRPCAVFEYDGDAHPDKAEARRVLDGC